jgi:hypothetical protein
MLKMDKACSRNKIYLIFNNKHNNVNAHAKIFHKVSNAYISRD